MITIFDTRTMLDALEQMYMPKTFLLNTFFKDIKTFDTETVDIDIIRGGRKLAPFVSPLAEGKVMKREGQTTHSFKPPYIKPKMATTAADIQKRRPGEVMYQGGKTPQQRAAEQVGEDLDEMRNASIRREEWMASQLLQDGKVQVTGEGVDAEVDFKMPADHIITLGGSDVWTDPDSDPLTDLRTWRRKAAKDSGLVIEKAVFGSDVLDAFLLHEGARKALDTRRVTLGEIDPQNLEPGVIFWGDIEGLSIYTYDEYYEDEAGDLQPMVPVDMIFMGSSKAKTSRSYGAILDLDLEGPAAVQFFPKSWTEKDPSVRWIMLQSAPLVSLHQSDAFMSIKAV